MSAQAIPVSNAAMSITDTEERPSQSPSRRSDAAIVHPVDVSMADVLVEVTKIISKHSSLNAEVLKAETRLDEIDVQSLDLVEIVFEIEDRFKIDVPFN